MKNLFEYATKELSQDAFLRWLIENWNESDDKELQRASRGFLDFLTDNAYSHLDYEKAKIVTYAQVAHMDITIDVFPDKDKKLHDIIVIEDKTGSSEHNQLVDYNETLRKWKNQKDGNVRDIHKVFYKSGYLSDQDDKGIKKANEGEESTWKTKDIRDIWKFFKDYTNASSDVLRDYSRYIERLHKADIGEIEEGNLEKLLPFEWECLINKWYPVSVLGKDEAWVSSYQGRYVSICYRIDFLNKGVYKRESFTGGATLEIFIREKKWFSAVLHHSFKVPERDDRAWNIYDIENKDHFKRAEELRNELVEFINNDSSGYFTKVKKDAFSCFGKIKEKPGEIKDLKEAEKLIKEWILWFRALVANFDKRGNTGTQFKPLTTEEVSKMTVQELIQRSVEIAVSKGFRLVVIEEIEKAEQNTDRRQDLEEFLEHPDWSENTLVLMMYTH